MNLPATDFLLIAGRAVFLVSRSSSPPSVSPPGAAPRAGRPPRCSRSRRSCCSGSRSSRRGWMRRERDRHDARRAPGTARGAGSCPRALTRLPDRHPPGARRREPRGAHVGLWTDARGGGARQSAARTARCGTASSFAAQGHLKSRVTRADTGAVPVATPRSARQPDYDNPQEADSRVPAERSAALTAPAGETAASAAAAADDRCSWPPKCTVAEADALKAQLAARLQESEPVTLDVSALQRIDTAGLQLLAAFVRDRRTAGRASHGAAGHPPWKRRPASSACATCSSCRARPADDRRSDTVPCCLFRRELRGARCHGGGAAEARCRLARAGADQHHLPRRAFHQGRQRDIRILGDRLLHPQPRDAAR